MNGVYNRENNNSGNSSPANGQSGMGNNKNNVSRKDRQNETWDNNYSNKQTPSLEQSFVNNDSPGRQDDSGSARASIW